jgi:cytochrome c biogenesis protein CcdA
MIEKVLRAILFAVGIMGIGTGVLGIVGILPLTTIWWTILVGISCITGGVHMIRRSRDPHLLPPSRQLNEELKPPATPSSLIE